MTDSTLPPPPMADLVGPIMKSATLIAAGKVGLFHALADGPRSISELSEDLGASENGLACLAEALTTIGYLERQDGRFANGPTARAWLTPSSSIDFNSLLIYLEHTWRLLADLGEVVRKGSPELSFAQYMLDHPDAGSAYNEYMKGCAKLDEDFLRRTLSLPEDARRMLDLGGAHGWYTAVFGAGNIRTFAQLSSTWPRLWPRRKIRSPIRDWVSGSCSSPETISWMTSAKDSMWFYASTCCTGTWKTTIAVSFGKRQKPSCRAER